MSDLDSLKKAINQFKQKTNKPKQNRGNSFSALTVCSEIVGSMIFALVLGTFLDRFFATKFVFSFILLILGLISSLYSIYKKIKKHEDS